MECIPAGCPWLRCFKSCAQAVGRGCSLIRRLHPRRESLLSSVIPDHTGLSTGLPSAWQLESPSFCDPRERKRQQAPNTEGTVFSQSNLRGDVPLFLPYSICQKQVNKLCPRSEERDYTRTQIRGGRNPGGHLASYLPHKILQTLGALSSLSISETAQRPRLLLRTEKRSSLYP